jgi:hypothetical protein
MDIAQEKGFCSVNVTSITFFTSKFFFIKNFFFQISFFGCDSNEETENGLKLVEKNFPCQWPVL